MTLQLIPCFDSGNRPILLRIKEIRAGRQGCLVSINKLVGRTYIIYFHNYILFLIIFVKNIGKKLNKSI